MQDWDDFKEPTEDERAARRVLAVAIALINASIPLSTTRIRREFYEGMSDDSFRRAFLRDRNRLATTGLTVVRQDLTSGEVGWQVDEERSFVRESKITPEDALVLDCLLLPLATDPSYPYARDLRLALTKIDRSFDGRSMVALPPEARQRNRYLSQIEECMTRRHAVHMSYTRADGSKLERSVAPLGLFPLHGTTYLVGAPLSADGACADEAHVYNLDRVRSVREERSRNYEIPPDFDVRDFIRLPYQMGPRIYEARFRVPADRESDLRAKVAGNGTWAQGAEPGEGAMTLLSPVSEEQAAARWAVAEGIEPLHPQSLREAWMHILKDAANGGRYES